MTIKQRQHLLAYLGYYVGPVDGDWGSGSREAAKAFQKDYNFITGKGILEDGYGGPETDKALRYAVANDLMKQEPAPDLGTGDQAGTFWDGIRYWTREEFRCQCGGKYCNGFPEEPDETLVELVDDLRDRAGRPGHRTSGLRCPTWNAIQNGAKNSKHTNGKALDFFIEGMSGQQLLALAQADPRTSYAYIIIPGEPYVHVDVA